MTCTATSLSSGEAASSHPCCVVIPPGLNRTSQIRAFVCYHWSQRDFVTGPEWPARSTWNRLLNHFAGSRARANGLQAPSIKTGEVINDNKEHPLVHLRSIELHYRY